MLGGPRLAPRLSPRKTWAGAVTGFVVTPAVAVLYAGTVLNPLETGRTLGVGAALLTGAVISVSGQVGDLAESLFKREVGVKDSSTLIPGHGGMLDRVDSLLFVLPVTAGMLRLLGLT